MRFEIFCGYILQLTWFNCHNVISCLLWAGWARFNQSWCWWGHIPPPHHSQIRIGAGIIRRCRFCEYAMHDHTWLSLLRTVYYLITSTHIYSLLLDNILFHFTLLDHTFNQIEIILLISTILVKLERSCKSRDFWSSCGLEEAYDGRPRCWSSIWCYGTSTRCSLEHG